MPSRAGGTGGRSTAKKSKKKATKKKTAAKKPAKAKSTKKKTTRRKTAVKKSPEQAGGGSGRLRVRQVRSGIGSPAGFRRTLTALGLKHHQDEVLVPDNPSIRGMLKKVHHLVSMRPEGENV